MGIRIAWGPILRYYRNKHKLTQEEVADAIKIPRQQYSKWECDTGYPTAESISLLSNLYDEDLFRYVIKNVPSEYLEELAELKRHINASDEMIKNTKGRKKTIRITSDIPDD